jgi:hypothetical protein
MKAVKQQIPQHHRAELPGTTLLITTQIPALRHNRIETGFDWLEFGKRVVEVKVNFCSMSDFKSMMKYRLIFLILIFPFLVGSARDKETPISASANTKNISDKNDDAMSRIKIKIGNKTFIATLSDNATVTAFKALLPLTMMMMELNGNEKYSDLPISLPKNASRLSSIQTGDLLLFGSRTLVLFYETFSTAYSYTKLGRIDDPAGLAAALGSGNVTVTFEIP